MNEGRQAARRIPHPGWWLVWGAVACVAILSLRIYDTAVTAAGLMQLAELPELENLEISEHQVSMEVLYDLKHQRPMLQVVIKTDENDGSGFSRRPRTQNPPAAR